MHGWLVEWHMIVTTPGSLSSLILSTYRRDFTCSKFWYYTRYFFNFVPILYHSLLPSPLLPRKVFHHFFSERLVYHFSTSILLEHLSSHDTTLLPFSFWESFLEGHKRFVFRPVSPITRSFLTILYSRLSLFFYSGLVRLSRDRRFSKNYQT